MTNDPFQLYPVIAQIAATFAGFGSLASGLGQRSAGADPRIDAYRLSLMLFASLSATIFALLPATLVGLAVADETALRVSATGAAAVIAISMPRSAKRVLGIRHVAGFNVAAGLANTLCNVTAFVAFAACALGAAKEHLAGLYLLGLMALLGSSIIMFSRGIVSILRPHSEG